MKYSTESVDFLFGQWRQNEATSGYGEILDYARQFSAFRNTGKTNTAQAEKISGDMDRMIDGLYRQARTSSLESAIEIAVDDQIVRHNIIANAMNQHALLAKSLANKASRSNSASSLNQIFKPFPNVAKWCTGISRSMYAIATLVLFAAGAITYLNVLQQQTLHRESIVYMDISGEYNYEMALLNDMAVLGFARDSSPQKYQFHLGRTFSKISHLDGVPNDENLQRLLEPHAPAFALIGRQLLTGLVESLVNSPDQIGEVIDPYLAEPAIYAGYWVQNALFASETESVRDVGILINHVDLLPALKKLLSAEQFTKASELIQGYRKESVTVSSMEIQKFSKMLWIWLD